MSTSRRLSSHWLAFVVAITASGGCGDALVAAAGESTDGGSTTNEDRTTTDASDHGESSDDADTSTEGTSSSDGSTTGAPTCGNGELDPGEECDDPDDDACRSDCLLACGLEWELVRSAPTPLSTIFGSRAAVDAAGNVFAIGQQLEVTFDRDGAEVYGPWTAIVLALDPDGVERWTVLRVPPQGVLRPFAVVADDVGDVYFTSIVEDGAAVAQVVKLAGADGAQLWTHDIVAPIPGPPVGDAPTWLALAPDGSIVVAATVPVADGDDDVWVRRIDADLGAEVWTTSFDGPSTGMFSTDDAGPVAVADDGTILVLAQPYIDFETAPATVVAFAPQGGAPLWTWTADEGAPQEHESIAIATDPLGNTYAAWRRPTSVSSFLVAKLASDGTEIEVLDHEQLLPSGLDGWAWLADLDVTPDGGLLLTGAYQIADSGYKVATWVAQRDADGSQRCASTHPADPGPAPGPSFYVGGTAVGADGHPVIAGSRETGSSSFWVARFRSG